MPINMNDEHIYDGFRLTWAGECSAWECDELGHLNMRHYVGKFSQAREFLFIQLGLINAFKSAVLSTVRVKESYIKYQAEARPGQPLKIMSAVLSVAENTVHLCHIMYHADGRVAATQVETVEHIYLRNHQAFKWPSRLLENANRVCSDCPDTPPQSALPRNIDTQTPHIGQSREAFEALGVAAIGAGVFTEAEMDASGFASTQAIFGRLTSTAAWFMQGWPELHDTDYTRAQGSGAILETFTVFHALPRQGDSYEFRAVILAADSYTRTFLFNLNDAVTGHCISSHIVNACLFNLGSRTLTKNSPEGIAALTSHIIAGLVP